MKAFLSAVVGLTGAGIYRGSARSPADAKERPTAFSQKAMQPYKLIDVQTETHDSKRFRFELADPSTPLDLHVASCITLAFTDAVGTKVVRPYTPINRTDDRGHFDIVVKCYPNSKMGSHLFSLKKGDTIEAQGPWPKLTIAPSQYAHIGMLAGGTGITPLYQVANNILAEPTNTTVCSLLYSNHTEQDVLLGKELEELTREHPNSFACFHCFSQPPKRWNGYSGHVTPSMISATMPKPSQRGQAMVLVCGPPGYMNSVCGPMDYSSLPPKQGELGGHLKELGYSQDMVFKF